MVFHRNGRTHGVFYPSSVLFVQVKPTWPRERTGCYSVERRAARLQLLPSWHCERSHSRLDPAVPRNQPWRGSRDDDPARFAGRAHRHRNGAVDVIRAAGDLAFSGLTLVQAGPDQGARAGNAPADRIARAEHLDPLRIHDAGGNDGKTGEVSLDAGRIGNQREGGRFPGHE